MERTFAPGTLRGTMQAPPSKSEAHRRMICAALASGCSHLSGFASSKDMEATMNCLTALGASFRAEGTQLTVTGVPGRADFAPAMDCGESGSTLRFLLPVSLAAGEGGRFLLHGRLGERPLSPYAPIFAACGVQWAQTAETVEVRGRLKPGRYTLPGNVSSQFVSGMLFALPLLAEDSFLQVEQPVESAGYIRMTVQCLQAHGIVLEELRPWVWRVPGNQRYQARDAQLPGDWSQGAVPLCAAALGHPVTVAGLPGETAQGDRAAAEVLARLGACPHITAEGWTCSGGALRGACFTGRDIPDIVPVLALVCTQAAGESRITDCGRLRLKESDRFAATVELLRALGAEIHGEGDDLVIRGPVRLQGGCTLSARNDHRLVMLLALAATLTVQPVTVQGVEALEKSWPTFLAQYAELGGSIK